jgi:ribosomal protein L20
VVTEGETAMKIEVKRKGKKVWLDGVTGWFVGDKESSVHAAQEAVMQAAGYDITYDYLVGVSGLAFRMQVHKSGLCPSSPHPFCGFRCVAGSTQALPLTMRVFEVKSDQKGKVAEARKAVVESIDRSLPVQYGSEEDGIIVGYQNDGEEWICYHPMQDGGKKTFIETKWPWGIAVFGPAKERVPSRRELAITTLEQAVQMARIQEAEAYFVGFRAWKEYIASLRELQTADTKTRKDAMLGNAWIYECLAQYRACGARYLQSIAGEFIKEAAVHLRRAADLCNKMSSEVLRDEAHCVVTVAPYPWALKKGETWSDETLRGEIKRLEEALPIEREALRGIEAALTIIKKREGGPVGGGPDSGTYSREGIPTGLGSVAKGLWPLRA